ncbi:MAG: hypothetical protein J1F63_00930 [Oscillospiraceae bacterium]|nr:hypothetical protein [Oscillospiraceae bacterium]
MENYVDFLVKKKITGGDAAKMAVVAIALVFIVASVGLWLGLASAFVVLVFGGYVAWLAITSITREYEYVVINDHMDVDEIIAGRHRRRLCGFDFGSMEICASVHDNDKNAEMKRKFTKRYDAASDPNAENARFAVFSGEEGIGLLVFEPNEKILDAMKMYVKSKVF